MKGGAALARIQEKRRHGLLLMWCFERLTSALARLGVTVQVSVIYSETAGDAGPPRAGLSGCTTGFAAPADLAEVALVEAYPFGREDLVERAAGSAECFVLRHEGRIVAFTWCRFADPPHRLGLTLGPQDAYLFDAHTAPSCRGLNLLPFLRHQLYGELIARGRTNLLSSTVAFNRPAHRFKEKLGARPRETRMYLRLFGRFDRTFTLYRFSAG
jgi:hypothetical protein